MFLIRSKTDLTFAVSPFASLQIQDCIRYVTIKTANLVISIHLIEMQHLLQTHYTINKWATFAVLQRIDVRTILIKHHLRISFEKSVDYKYKKWGPWRNFQTSFISIPIAILRCSLRYFTAKIFFYKNYKPNFRSKQKFSGNGFEKRNVYLKSTHKIRSSFLDTLKF